MGTVNLYSFSFCALTDSSIKFPSKDKVWWHSALCHLVGWRWSGGNCDPQADRAEPGI